MSEGSQKDRTFTLRQGTVPLLVSMPHIGRSIPVELTKDFQPQALSTEDTDWHLDLLYDFLPDVGASVLKPHTSRYVIDLNRPPDDKPMYPGASNTELCPTRLFNGEPLYKPGLAPSRLERDRRKAVYWEPYHEALASELDRLRGIHGFVLLWDAHSIRSQIPWLFDGKLPDLNVGTADGTSADENIAASVIRECKAAPHVTTALNGRFKGGYITRNYGKPATGVHAIQLEMCQSLYMQEMHPYDYDSALALQIQPLLKKMVTAALDATVSCYAKQ